MNKPIYLIAATSTNSVIGVNNELPWHYSCDLKKFKELTTGNTVIMGRRTFDSLGGKPLPNRENFVLSRSSREKKEGVTFFTSLEEAIDSATKEKIFVIGGESLYRQAIQNKKIEGIYLTRIHENYAGDAHFPNIPNFYRSKGKPEVLQEKDPKIELIYLENTGTANLP